MSLQRNMDRIRTTHVGSLPRPHALLDALRARLRGEPYDEAAYAGLLARSVAEVVRRQAECGIDFVTDGEYSKLGFFTYVQERLEGFEPRPGAQALARDIENVKAAASAAGLPLDRVFLPATAPSGVGANEYYPSEEAYLEALAVALGQEYRAIIDAGLLLQIDDPGLSEVFSDPSLDAAGQRRRAQRYVEATNAALAGIPRERVPGERATVAVRSRSRRRRASALRGTQLPNRRPDQRRLVELGVIHARCNRMTDHLQV